MACRTAQRVVVRVALGLTMFLLTLLASTGTAFAHAQLVSSDPPSGAVLQGAPTRVTLTFGDSVAVSKNAIEVYDDHLRRVDTGSVRRVGGDDRRIQVGLLANLHTGTYVVSWHVSSSDTHPVAGTFQFSVGAPSTVSANIPGIGRNGLASILLGGVRALGYAGLVLCPGVLLVSLALWPAGLGLPRTRRLLFFGLGLLFVGALGSLLLEGVWASGRPLSAMWSAPRTLDTRSRRFDFLYALRFYLLLIFAAVLFFTLAAERKAAVQARSTPDKRGRRTSQAQRPPGLPLTWQRPLLLSVVAVTCLVLLTTWTLAGHAAAGTQTFGTITADLLHLSAMTVWLGGLVLLTVVLLPADRADELAVVLPRFSRVAFTCVVVLVVSGSYQLWRNVGSLDALRFTDYGRLLFIKLAAVLGVVALGSLARRWVQRSATDHPAPVRVLQRGLLAEVGIASVVLGITATLVVLVPGRESFIRPFHQTITAAGAQIGVRIDRPRVGDTVLHLNARTAKGNPLSVERISGSLSEAQAKLGPLPIRLSNATGATANGRQDIGLTFPQRGRWVLALAIQTSPSDVTTFTVTVGVN